MKKRLLTLLIFSVALSTLLAQPKTPPIPIDPKVRVGHLDNGLTYYIRHNEEPKGQANFYIAQKVGSILEEEEQRGLAHFLEHMCFNGTQHFPGNGVIKYCEKIGVKFGTDLNAYTSIDETVYNIDNVPVAKVPDAVDSCLWILHDWADGLLLTDDDIDHERGVIHEEWRSRNSARQRMYDQILPEIYPGNRYGQRMPIGLMSVVDSFPYHVLRDYYEKWYRPDQQGIVVVGDVNVDEMEAKIKRIFNTIEIPKNPAERYYVQVEGNKNPIVAIAKDKENTYAISNIYIKHPAYPDSLKGFVGYYESNVSSKLAMYMLTQRLEELSQMSNPPFIDFGISNGNFFFSKTLDAFSGIVVTKDDDVLTGLGTIYREMLRAIRNGFTPGEFERAKAVMLTQMESSYNERNKVKSKDYCKQYVRHFIDNEPIPGIEMEYLFGKQLIENMPLEEVNDYMRSLDCDSNLVVIAMLTDKEGITYPTENEIIETLNSIKGEEIVPYEDRTSNAPLIANFPKPGKITKKENASFGYTKLTMSNGATIYYKSTDFKADEIQMTAFSKGGTCQYGDNDLPSLKVINEVFDLGGIGDFSITEIRKKLAGKKVTVQAAINTYSETMDARTTPKDFKTMMQVAYLYFTALRSDNDAFQSWLTKEKGLLANKAANPMAAMSDSISTTLYPDVKRMRSITLEELEKIDYERIMTIAKERFANAGDFTFVFTGNIEEGIALPFFEQYIGSLPSAKKTENYKDFGGLPKNGTRENKFKHEMETPTATIAIYFNGTNGYTAKNKLALSIAEQILKIVMTEEIREKEGGTYGVRVSSRLSNIPKANEVLQVYYQTDPEKYEYLNKRIIDILKDFTKNGGSEENLAKVKEYMMKKHKENLRENSYFANILTEYVMHGVDNETNYEEMLNSITNDDIRTIISDLLKQKNKVTVIMHGVKE